MALQVQTSSCPSATRRVFLSFSQDTATSFSDHLYVALDNAGFHTFRGEESIEKGQNMELQLEKAIRDSRISIVVLSQDFAYSRRCLDDLVMILRQRTIANHQVLPIFYNVDPSHVRHIRETIEKGLAEQENVFRTEVGRKKNNEYWKEKMERWKAALKEIADLAGMNLQNQADRHEAKFIKKIIRVVEDKLSRACTRLNVDQHLVGINSQVEDTRLWLQDENNDVKIFAICGMGGIGKTTIANYLYDQNSWRFEASCFLDDVRESSKQPEGLIRLQEQLLSRILGGLKIKINSVREGIDRIKDALPSKKVLLVFDDLDDRQQLFAILGMQICLSAGSKIIITTRNEGILRAQKGCKVHQVRKLSYDESLELFSWHAFGQQGPDDDWVNISRQVVDHCDGLPLAIKVLGSSFCGLELKQWENQLEKLKCIPHKQVDEKLKISYDALGDDEDRNLFLHIACFFVGEDKNKIVDILDECDFHTAVGIQNLIDRCLLTIDDKNKLVMHHLVRDMGRAVVHQESTKKPGERSRVWKSKDSIRVLMDKTGTEKVEGFTLNMHDLMEDKSSKKEFGANNRKRKFEEFQDKSSASNWDSLKRHVFDFSSWFSASTPPGNSNMEETLETEAFTKMRYLKLLQLGYVRLSGSYAKLPKGLRWLQWHGFPLPSIPNDLCLERLVILEMPFSRLKNVWTLNKCLENLKILNLSHSYCLARTPDFSMLPNLEKLILSYCIMLVEVHESVGHLQRLVLLDLSYCTCLRKLPKSMGRLEHLVTLDISGCSKLENFAVQTRPCRVYHKLWLSKRPTASSTWALLPHCIVSLKLRGCNLTNDAFPRDLSSMSGLREIDLSENLISTLPNCITAHTGINVLVLKHCPKIQSIEWTNELREVDISYCSALQKVVLRRHQDARYGFNLGVMTGCPCLRQEIHLDHNWCIKNRILLMPWENAPKMVIQDLGLSNSWTIGNPRINLAVSKNEETRVIDPQVIWENDVISTYLPWSSNSIPAKFSLRNKGSSISFIMPSSPLNSVFKGFNIVCFWHTLPRHHWFVVSIINQNKNVYSICWTFARRRWTFARAIREDDQDIMCFLYPLYQNTEVEAGDKIDISVLQSDAKYKGASHQVTEIGVRILYQQEKDTWSHTWEEYDLEFLNKSHLMVDLAQKLKQNIKYTTTKKIPDLFSYDDYKRSTFSLQ